MRTGHAIQRRDVARPPICSAAALPRARITCVAILNDGPGSKNWREIVGVVRAVHHDSLDEPSRGTVYLPLAQRTTASPFAVVYTDGDPLGVLSSVRAAVRAIDPELPVFDSSRAARPVALPPPDRDVADRRIRRARVCSRVHRRLRRDVVRGGPAGARDRDPDGACCGATWVMALILRGGVWIAPVGVLGGAVMVFVLVRIAGGLLFGVTVHDPLTYVGLAPLLILRALVAAYVPARRATAMKPLDPLR